MKKLAPIFFFVISFSLYGQNPKILTNLNVNPPASSGYNFIVKIGSKFIYKASGSNGYPQIWATDGSQSGTIQLTNFTAQGDIIYDQFRNNFAVLGNVLYFTVAGPGDGSGIPVVYLWKTDGTVSGTSQFDLSAVLTGHIYLDNRICANSNYLFLNIRFEPVAEPSLGAWKIYSISNTGQLQFVKKISNRQYFKKPDFYIFKDRMLTTGLTNPNADPNNGSQFQQCIYVSDGTTAGTTILASGIQSNAEYDNWQIIGDNYILTRALGWLVKIPGTAGTGIGVPESFYQLTGANRLLEPDIFGNNNYATGKVTNNAIANIGSTFFFRGRSAENGWELWKTDGTETGTQLVFDANPGIGDGQQQDMSGFILGNKFLFYSNISSSNGLWSTDGTTNNTIPLNKAITSTRLITRVSIENGKAIFSIQNGTGELWQTDGTSRGTVQINPDKYKPTPATLIMGLLSPGNLLYVSTSDFTYKLMGLNTNYRAWYGDISSNWNDPSNWEDNSIPAISDNVLIPGSTTNNPIINTNSFVNSLWVERNNVTVNNGIILNINGQLEIQTAMNGSGSINFTGNSNSALGGDGTLPLSVTLSGGDVSLLNSVTLPGLNFQSAAKVLLNNYDLNVTQPNGITGYAADRYVVTNGNGRLILPAIGTAASSVSAIFPIGNSAVSYTPATVTNNGTSQQFNARAIAGLYPSYNTTYPESPTSSAYPNSAVNNTWFINKQGSGQVLNASVQLQWNASDELSGFTRTSINLAHYVSSVWNRGPSGAASGSNPYTFSRTGLSTFSPFGVVNTNLVLPVSLLSFSANYYDNKVKLEWATASEQNSSHFIIERSSNGADYFQLGRKEAAGTSNSSLNYDFTDIYPLTGTSFYRLKMFDRDNNYTISRVVSVKNNLVKTIEIFPNPAHNDLQVQLSSAWNGTINLKITDLAGKVVDSRVLQSNGGQISTSIDISKLSPGVYFLIIINENRKEVQKFIIR